MPERAYRAIVVLVSDGAPTPPDSWREPLDRMLRSERAGKAVRVAVGIGADRGTDAEHVLRSFSSDGVVLRADEVGKLSAIFEQFTTTVTTQIARWSAGASAGRFGRVVTVAPTHTRIGRTFRIAATSRCRRKRYKTTLAASGRCVSSSGPGDRARCITCRIRGSR